MTSWLAAGLSAAALLTACEPPRRPRVKAVRRSQPVLAEPDAVSAAYRLTTGPIARRSAAGAAGLTLGWVVGGPPGLLTAVLAAIVVDRLLARLPTAADERLRARIHADVPLAGDLLAATVGAGAPLTGAARAVGIAIGGPLGGELARAARALELGASPHTAWAELLADPVTATLARPLVRAAERGSPPAPALLRAAEALRREAADRAAAAAEAAGVRAVGPLGACFLPAFVLLAIVPLVAAMAGSLLGSL